jgi:hypothetical protein
MEMEQLMARLCPSQKDDSQDESPSQGEDGHNETLLKRD